MADSDDEHQDEAPEKRPHAVCPTCLGARKVFSFQLIDGRTRRVSTQCPTCVRGQPRILPGI